MSAPGVGVVVGKNSWRSYFSSSRGDLQILLRNIDIGRLDVALAEDVGVLKQQGEVVQLDAGGTIDVVRAAPLGARCTC